LVLTGKGVGLTGKRVGFNWEKDGCFESRSYLHWSMWKEMRTLLMR